MCKRTQRAVSIVELLVVVVILLVFSTLTIISYHNMTRGLVARSQANEFNAAFVLARELSITNSAPHRVVIDRPSRTFWIDRLNSSGQVEMPKVSGTEPFLQQTRLENVTVNGTQVAASTSAEIVFRPDGSSEQAALQVTQQGADLNDESEYFSLVLYAPQGTARIYPNERR